MFACLVIAVLAITMATNAVIDPSWPFPEPIQLKSENGRLDIQLTAATYRYRGKDFDFNTRAFYYNGEGSLPGPTLRVKAGDTIRLTIINAIDHSDKGGDSSDYSSLSYSDYSYSFDDFFPKDTESSIMDIFRPVVSPPLLPPRNPAHPWKEHSQQQSQIQDSAESDMQEHSRQQRQIQDSTEADTVNFYTHGLRIDPKDDSIMIGIKPNQSYTYTIKIPTNHAPGTSWYSSHRPGSAAYHASSGLVGAIIVDPLDPTDIPEALSNIPHYPLVFQEFNFHHMINCGCSRRLTFLKNSIPCFHEELGDTMDLDLNVDESHSDHIFYTINGFQAQIIHMGTDQGRVLRFVNAGSSTTLELEINGCDMFLIARDGIYRSQSSLVDVVVLFPGSRADIIVSCLSPGSFNLESVQNASRNTMFLNRVNTRLTQTLVHFHVSPFFSAPSPLPMQLPGAPSYLTDFGEEHTSLPLTIGDDSAVDFILECHNSRLSCKHTFNGNSVGNAPGSKHSTVAGTAEDWLLTLSHTTVAVYPVHIHANHFQVLSSNSSGVGVFYDIGEWRDTIPVDDDVLIRIPFDSRFHGPVVIHSSILLLEDKGMIEVIRVNRPLPEVGDPDVNTNTGTNTGNEETGNGKVTSSADTVNKSSISVFILISSLLSSALKI